MNWARLLGLEKPNVKSLARSGDVDGLIEAARYREVVRRVDGRVSDAGAPVREAAILALHEKAGDRAGETLTRALRDPADRVRCAAVLALYERGEAEPLAEAAGLLRDEDGQALATAFRALLELQQPGSTLKLAQVIVYREDERPLSEVDASFLRALVEVEGPQAGSAVVELAIRALHDDREDVSERAEDVLELLAPESVDALMVELRAGAAPERAAAVLGRMKDARALDALVAALRHRDPRVRAEACTALGELRDPAASEPLLAATRDSEHLVRAAAGAALDRIGTAAVAVSVASLLRPLLEVSPAELMQALATDDAPLLETNGSGAQDGANGTMLRRVARFIDRIEDKRDRTPARSSRPHVKPGKAIAPHVIQRRVVSTHTNGSRAISFPAETGNGDGAPMIARISLPRPASPAKSSATRPPGKAPKR